MNKKDFGFNGILFVVVNVSSNLVVEKFIDVFKIEKSFCVIMEFDLLDKMKCLFVEDDL